MNTQVTRFITFFVIAMFSSQLIYACTDFKLTAKDGTVLITRTLEFPIDMKSNIRTSQRGREISALAPNGKAGLKWKAKFGYLSVDAFNQDIVVDGMNEAGLSFEYLYLPGETTYPTVPNGKDAQALPYYLFGDWVLSNFKSVDEVKNALANVYVYLGYMTGMPDTVFPVHASIFEANGKGIVVEFVGGKVNVYDSIGIMTNSPTYDWQVTNLRNYLNLSPYVPKSIVVNNIAYSVTGQGSGAVGLPGDVSPPSRFAKIAFLTTAAYPATNKDTVLNLAEHIIDNVDIPSGIARSVSNGKDFSDYTQWTVFKDLSHKVMYYRTYDDLTLRSVDMNKIDFTEKAQRAKVPMAAPAYIMDMTGKFTNANQAVAKQIAAGKISAAAGKINATATKN